jgi:hypothetical protein
VASINHGTYFYHAAMEGLLKNDTNIHGGIRTTLSGPSDYDTDGYCGFEIVEAREIDTIGTEGIIGKIRNRVGTENPVYLSIDIDTLDPACERIFIFYFLCVRSLLNKPNKQSHPPLAPRRRVAGPRASYGPLFVAWMGSISSAQISSRLRQRMTPTPSTRQCRFMFSRKLRLEG